MMFAYAEDIEPDAVRDDDLIDEIGHALSRGWELACHRIWKDGCKTVDTDFHRGPCSFLGYAPATALDVHHARDYGRRFTYFDLPWERDDEDRRIPHSRDLTIIAIPARHQWPLGVVDTGVFSSCCSQA
jgi:hypothetical protein